MLGAMPEEIVETVEQTTLNNLAIPLLHKEVYRSIEDESLSPRSQMCRMAEPELTSLQTDH